MINKLKDKIKMHFFRYSNSITYMEAKDLMKENSMAVLLDVRSRQEYDEYHLDGAICIPTYDIQSKIENVIENKNQLIIVYCQSGIRSIKAIKILEKMGYTNLYQIQGGIDNI